MPLGILEDYHLEHVPGTAPLEMIESAGIPEAGLADSLGLKYDPTGKIILVPQPSDDPNDPLNWPRWRKEMFIIATIWGTACVGAIGPLLVAAYVQLAQEWNVSLSKFASGTNGGLIVCLAGATVLTNVLAVKFGKRPIYLVTGVGLVLTVFWGSAAKSFGSFIASRALAGFCMAPMEGLVPASIADLWYVHERGLRTAMFNLAFMAGVSLGPLIAGQLIEHYSWRVCSYAMAGALVVNLLLTFFFMPETAFDRPEVVRIDVVNLETKALGKVHLEQVERSAGYPASKTSLETNNNIRGHVQASDRSSRFARKSFWNELDFWSGYNRPISFWKTLLGPLQIARSPIVLWTSIVFMTAITWIVILTIGASQIFVAPPYSFSVAAVGNTFLSPFLASIAGTLVAKPLIDGTVKFLAKRNHGIFEPEFRLPAMACYLLFTATGFFSAGQSLGSGMAWELPVILSLSFINFGVVLTVTVAITYTVDCHREQAAEAVSVMVLIKNMFAFGSTYYINDWIASSGVRNVFFALGGITAGMALSAIPVYVSALSHYYVEH
ncbi:hypothetical protein H2200_003226 [Cladophialophora chaetospira]|uniref:Major facilitator superfamily (MFS) profile domain-containing protein n=1 Tax=Cladophialophora chaetospira TaxID=386627 RepID=A0AA38XHU0_9EURO|nr:hypothetical protein H2200_003226 [Cladophialophora chaetospira]